MSHRALATVLAMLLCGAGCDSLGLGFVRVPAAPLQLTPVSEGLRTEHTTGAPLVEMVSCAPGGVCLTSRVYRDGTLYYLAEEPGGGAPTRWNPIAQLTAEGTQSLEDLYVELCGRTDPVLGNDAGSVLHRVTSPGCTQEFVVTGVPEGDLARISEATDIINRSVRPIPPAR